MKLGEQFKRFFEDRELAKISEELYGKEITITEMHSFLNKDSDRKIIFICNESDKYYYLPDSMEQYLSDEDIERVNNGDYIVGTFSKITTSNGYEMWIFTDKE